MTSPGVRQYVAAFRALLVFTVVLGLAYPLVMVAVAQVAFHHQANGSLVSHDGKHVGSSLIGQLFTNTKGAPLPGYFQPRPSAAGNGYDPLSTAASNLGPDNPDLVKAIRERRALAARLDGIPPSTVAPDALLASGSGLDPHISPEYAQQQVARVARVRGLQVAQVQKLVDDHTQGRILGILGEPRVNVLELNLALDALAGNG